MLVNRCTYAIKGGLGSSSDGSVSRPHGCAPVFCLFSILFLKFIRSLFMSRGPGASLAPRVLAKTRSMAYQSCVRLLNILRTLLGHSIHCSLYCASLIIVYASMYIPIVPMSIKERAQCLWKARTLSPRLLPQEVELAGFIAAIIVQECLLKSSTSSLLTPSSTPNLGL